MGAFTCVLAVLIGLDAGLGSQEVLSNDEDLKKKMAKYTEFQASVSAIERKET